jgi:DegV family protein with EDD domain
VGGVVVVTDSSTCLPDDLVASLGIVMLPISVQVPAGDLEDLDELDPEWAPPEDVEYAELSGANHPFVTEYLEAVESPGYDAAVVITPAIEFATMYRNALLAAELAERPVVTIDARTAAAGQALVVLAGAEAARAGASLEEVVRVVEDASRRVELVAALASLEPIRRSGPVPDSVLRAGELAGTRSVFRMRDGLVEPLGAASTTDAALGTICAAFAEHGPQGVERATVFHAGASALAARLADSLGRVDFVTGFSVAMQVHTGRGVVGAAWLPMIGH